MFEVESTKSMDAGKLTFTDEGINFVGRVGSDNGVQGKIDKQEFEPNEPNTITATVIGNKKYVFLQEEPYYTSQNINKLTPKITMNKDVIYYLVTGVRKFVEIYNGMQGGYKLSDIREHTLKLPVLTPEDTSPYWDYMAYFIHNIQQQYADQLEAKSEYELNLMCQILGVTREEIVQRVDFTQPQYTNTFKVDELFEGYAGKRVKKGDWEPGNIPYVTATVTNNGIDGYIGNPIIVKENLLTVNFFGDVFYQEGKVSFKDGTYGLKLINKSEECKDVYLGLATHIQKQTKQMGSYDDGLRLDDIKNIILELPVIAPNSKQIDWGAIRHVAVGGGINYLATRMEICNRDLAIIRQIIQ